MAFCVNKTFGTQFRLNIMHLYDIKNKRNCNQPHILLKSRIVCNNLMKFNLRFVRQRFLL